LKWDLHSTNNQMVLVTRNPEIYYCLPTFTNRNWKYNSLHHCVFWKPIRKNNNENAWYDNLNAKTPNRKLSDKMRWGYFIEKILNCKIGVLIDSPDNAKKYISKISKEIKELQNNEYSLYFIWIEI
jgi:hypothetical protein